MNRVYVIVEGQTEESFVKGPLAEALWLSHVFVTPIILGVPGQKGGRTKYVRVAKDVLRQLKQDRESYCTTMIDYYGLGSGFPGTPVPEHLNSLERVQHIERAVKDDICRQISGFRPDVRFIPYLSLHEHEALLFSDPYAFAESIGQRHLADRFQKVRVGFPTPEHINDTPEGAPSKRIAKIYSPYRKVIEGTVAAQAVGIPKMRRECAHFRSWLWQLENLPSI